MNPINSSSSVNLKEGVLLEKPQKENNLLIYGLFAAALTGTFFLAKGKKAHVFQSLSPFLKSKVTPSSLHTFPLSFSKIFSFPKINILTSIFKKPITQAPLTKEVSKVVEVVSKLPAPKKIQAESAAFFLTVPNDHPLRKEVTEVIVGHQTGHEIKNTELEGLPRGDMSSHVKTFTELCIEQGVICEETGKRLQTFFSNLHSIPTNLTKPENKLLAQTFANKVHALKSGESLSIEAGWLEKKSNTSSTGHYLIYTFTKKEEGLYDVYILICRKIIHRYLKSAQMLLKLLSEPLFSRSRFSGVAHKCLPHCTTSIRPKCWIQIQIA